MEEDLYFGIVSVDSIYEELLWIEFVIINNVLVIFKLDIGV